MRKALSYGLDGAIQVTDPAISGSDAIATARVLAAALKDEAYDLVIMGNQSSDARSMLVPAMLAEFLDVPALTYAKRLEVRDDGSVLADRETSTGHQTVESRLPVVVSASSRRSTSRATPRSRGSWRPRRSRWTPRTSPRSGCPPTTSGFAGSATEILEATPKPPRSAGDKVEDDGTGQVGAKALAEFLVTKKFI